MNLSTYNPPLEERIVNFARMEAPFNTVRVARRLGMSVLEVDQVLCEMVSARQLRRVWKNIDSDFWKAEELFDLWD